MAQSSKKSLLKRFLPYYKPYKKTHDGDAVVGAAYAVVEVLFASEIGTPVGEEVRILPLYLFPYRLPLRFRIVQGDFCPYLLLAGLGVQHMAFAVERELLVLHLIAFHPCSFLRAWDCLRFKQLFGRQTRQCPSNFRALRLHTFHPAVLSGWRPSHRAA